MSCPTVRGYLKQQMRVERWARRGRAPRGRGVRGGLGEASIVAREKTVEHALGLLERASLGQAQFHHEPILEGAKEAFDPALGLGDRAPIQRMPSSCKARPTCVDASRPASCSESVGGVRGSR